MCTAETVPLPLSYMLFMIFAIMGERGKEEEEREEKGEKNAASDHPGVWKRFKEVFVF